MFTTHRSARRDHPDETLLPYPPPRGRRRRNAVVAVLCAVAALAVAGCGASGSASGAASDTPSASSASSQSAAGTGTAMSASVITIKDFSFTTPASVSPGATVTVDNKDGLDHTVTADRGGAFDSPAPAGKSSFTAPTKPGSYPFHCSIHPEMHGTLVVA